MSWLHDVAINMFSVVHWKALQSGNTLAIISTICIRPNLVKWFWNNQPRCTNHIDFALVVMTPAIGLAVISYEWLLFRSDKIPQIPSRSNLYTIRRQLDEMLPMLAQVFPIHVIAPLLTISRRAHMDKFIKLQDVSGEPTSNTKNLYQNQRLQVGKNTHTHTQVGLPNVTKMNPQPAIGSTW